jgi:hypothetical protein
VLTLWSAVVTEHLGHRADTALTLGRAVAERQPNNLDVPGLPYRTGWASRA